MAEDAEVRLGADTKPAQDAMQQASDSISTSLQNMQKSLADFTKKNEDTTRQAKKNNEDLLKSFKELGGGIGESIEKIKGVVGTLAALIGGGLLFGEFVSHMKETNAELLTLESVLGMDSEKATEFAIALKIAGSNATEYTGMTLRMARQLKANEDQFVANKIAVRDAAGAFLPLDQVMQNAFDRMGQLKEGVDQAEFALSFFGRSVQDVYKLMVMLPAAQERAKTLMQEMGVEFGPQRQADVMKYTIEVNAFKEMLGVMADDVGAKVLPQLEGLTVYLAQLLPTAAHAAIAATVGLLTSMAAVTLWFKEVAVEAKASWDKLVLAAQYGWQALKSVATGGTGDLTRIWAEYNNKVLKIELEKNIALLGMEAELKKKMAVLWGSEGGAKDAGKPPFIKNGPDAFVPKATGSGQEQSDMPWLENVLKERQYAYNNLKEQQDSFETWSIANTRDYWANVLAAGNLSEQDQMAVENKFHDASRAVKEKEFQGAIAAMEAYAAQYKYNFDKQIEIAQQAYNAIAQARGKDSADAANMLKHITQLQQQAADQQIKIEDLKQKAIQMIAAGQYESAKASVDQALAMRRISVQQSLAIEQQYLDQKYAIDLAANQREQAANIDNPVKVQELKNQELAIEIKYQNDKTAIVNKAELDREQYALQAAQTIQDAMGTLFSSLANNVKNWRDAFKQAITSITQSLNQLAGNALAKQLFGPGTGGGDFLNKLTGSIFGGGAGEGATLTVAGTTLTTAGTALVSSAAALTSAAAALAVGGAGGGLGGLFNGMPGLFDLGGIPLFEAGTPYVPQTSLAVVHKGERIVPAKYNVGGVGSGAGLTMHNHFTISGPIDSRTMDQIATTTMRSTQRAIMRTAG